MRLFLVYLHFLSFIKRHIIKVVLRSKTFDFIREIQNVSQPITFDYWYMQNVKGINKYVYWPVHHTSKVNFPNHILVGKGSFPGYMPGCYIQGIGKIIIGCNSIFGPNVGIISANHDIYDHSKHKISKVEIGSNCWVGMNSIILPGVTLGDYTIVAAGSVVKDNFMDGYCVLAGNPAKIVKLLDKSKCVNNFVESKFRGYIEDRFFLEFSHHFFCDEIHDIVKEQYGA